MSPKEALPRSASPDEVRRNVEAARTEVGGLGGLLAEIERARWRIEHPYFGGLTAADWLRFMVIHTRHHLKIIADIERALDAAVAS